MGVKVRTTRVALNTSTGNQDITISGLGAASEIKAAMFIVTEATVDATDTNEARYSLGITDGSTHRVVSAQSQHSSGSTDTDSRSATDEVIQILTTTGTIDMEANFVTFITDGVRINIGNAGTAKLCTVVLWAGTDVSAEVHEFSTNATVGGTTTVTAGFEFDHMIALTARLFFDDTSDADFQIGLGLCSNDGGGAFTQGCVVQAEVNSEGSGSPQFDYRDNRIENVDVVFGGAAEVTSATSTSFVVTTRDSSGSVDVAVLIISYGGVVSHWVDNDQSSPTSTGDHDVTDVGFKPQFAMHVMHMSNVINTLLADDRAGVLATGSFDDTSEFAQGVSLEDASATTDTQSRSDAKAAFVRADDGASTLFDGTFQSFLSNGYRINYATADGTVRHWIALAVEEEVAATIVKDPIMSPGVVPFAR